MNVQETCAAADPASLSVTFHAFRTHAATSHDALGYICNRTHVSTKITNNLVAKHKELGSYPGMRRELV